MSKPKQYPRFEALRLNAAAVELAKKAKLIRLQLTGASHHPSPDPLIGDVVPLMVFDELTPPGWNPITPPAPLLSGTAFLPGGATLWIPKAHLIEVRNGDAPDIYTPLL